MLYLIPTLHLPKTLLEYTVLCWTICSAYEPKTWRGCVIIKDFWAEHATFFTFRNKYRVLFAYFCKSKLIFGPVFIFSTYKSKLSFYISILSINEPVCGDWIWKVGDTSQIRKLPPPLNSVLREGQFPPTLHYTGWCKAQTLVM